MACRPNAERFRHSVLLGAADGRATGPLLNRFMGRHWKHRLEVAIFWDTWRIRSYTLIGVSGHLWQACCASRSRIWQFDRMGISTTLLQMQSDDKFRGRVFAADLGLCMFTLRRGVSGGRLWIGLRRA